MSHNAIKRIVRLVHDMGENAHLWFIDATNRNAVQCCSVSIDSPEAASAASQAADQDIRADESTAKIIELLDSAAVSAAATGTYSTVKDILEFLGGDHDAALQNNARRMLQELDLV